MYVVQQCFVAAQVVTQTPRRSHHHLRAHTQGFELRAHRRAAVHGQHFYATHLAGIFFKRGSHLNGQLAGRHQNQRLRGVGFDIQLAEQRQRKGGGFTGTGLRLANHVVAIKNDGDSLRLNRRRLFVAHRGQRGENVRMQIKCGKAAELFGHGVPHGLPCTEAVLLNQ